MTINRKAVASRSFVRSAGEGRRDGGKEGRRDGEMRGVERPFIQDRRWKLPSNHFLTE